jgi:hypothetical protein
MGMFEHFLFGLMAAATVVVALNIEKLVNRLDRIIVLLRQIAEKE